MSVLFSFAHCLSIACQMNRPIDLLSIDPIQTYQFCCKLTRCIQNVDPVIFQTFYTVDVAQNEGTAQQTSTGSDERQTSKQAQN
jgi:hypothetical protein